MSKSKTIAEATWKRGILHLTVDGDGLVSLWDEPLEAEPSYLKLELTPEQVTAIEATMARGGATP